MSYEKAMKHTSNVKKCRKQSNNYFGFDTGSGRWPAAASLPYVGPCMNIKRWWSDRADPYTRECIREEIQQAKLDRFMLTEKKSTEAFCLYSIIPEAAVFSGFDGFRYARIPHRLDAESLRVIEDFKNPVMLRFDNKNSFVENGVAHVWFAAVGVALFDKITLPSGVVARRTATYGRR